MKDKDSYVFTSDQKFNQMLSRQTLTMDTNKVMHSVSNPLPSKTNITSHSFRIGYISQLWKDTEVLDYDGLITKLYIIVSTFSSNLDLNKESTMAQAQIFLKYSIEFKIKNKYS